MYSPDSPSYQSVTMGVQAKRLLVGGGLPAVGLAVLGVGVGRVVRARWVE